MTHPHVVQFEKKRLARFLTDRIDSISNKPIAIRSFGDNVGSWSAKRIENYLDLKASKRARSIARSHLKMFVYQYDDFFWYGITLISKNHKNRICLLGEERLEFEIVDQNVVIPPQQSLISLIRYERCRGKSMMAIPISVGWDEEWHANMLLIHRLHKTIEHFEPHGKTATHLSPDVNQHLVDAMKTWTKASFPDYKWVGRDKTCPFVRPQIYKEIDLDGTCQLWSLWYLNVRIENPLVEDVGYLIQESYEAISNKNKFIYEFALQIAAAAIENNIQLEMDYPE
jgi:hypothetical protein